MGLAWLFLAAFAGAVAAYWRLWQQYRRLLAAVSGVGVLSLTIKTPSQSPREIHAATLDGGETWCRLSADRRALSILASDDEDAVCLRAMLKSVR